MLMLQKMSMLLVQKRVGALPLIVGTAFGTTTATMPAHVVGDLLVITSFRSNATPPGAHSGWTSIQSAGANSSSYTVSYKIAASSGETTPSSSSSTATAITVIRNVASLGNFIGDNLPTSSTSIVYSPMSLNDISGRSILVLTSWAGSATSNIQNPPAGLVFVAGQEDGLTPEMAMFDSGGARLSNWGGDSVALGTTSRVSYFMLEVTGA